MFILNFRVLNPHVGHGHGFHGHGGFMPTFYNQPRIVYYPTPVPQYVPYQVPQYVFAGPQFPVQFGGRAPIVIPPPPQGPPRAMMIPPPPGPPEVVVGGAGGGAPVAAGEPQPVTTIDTLAFVNQQFASFGRFERVPGAANHNVFRRVRDENNAAVVDNHRYTLQPGGTLRRTGGGDADATLFVRPDPLTGVPQVQAPSDTPIIASTTAVNHLRLTLRSDGTYRLPGEPTIPIMLVTGPAINAADGNRVVLYRNAGRGRAAQVYVLTNAATGAGEWRNLDTIAAAADRTRVRNLALLSAVLRLTPHTNGGAGAGSNRLRPVPGASGSLFPDTGVFTMRGDGGILWENGTGAGGVRYPRLVFRMPADGAVAGFNPFTYAHVETDAAGLPTAGGGTFRPLIIRDGVFTITNPAGTHRREYNPGTNTWGAQIPV